MENQYLWYSGFAMLVSHALMSTNSFLLVDSISRRFKTRLITELSGINFLCPKLFYFSLFNLIIFLGFPGTLFFISEVIFFTFLIDMFPIFGAIISFFFIYLNNACIFFYKLEKGYFLELCLLNFKIVNDLEKSEIVIFSSFLNFTYYFD